MMEIDNHLDDDLSYPVPTGSSDYLRHRQEVFSITSSGRFLTSVRDSPNVTLCFRNVTVVVKKQQTQTLFPFITSSQMFTPSSILQNVTGIAKPGELLGIMGSSGSGKSTLLSVLMGGNLPPNLKMEGIVTVNGRKCSTMLSRISAYLQQNESFFPMLTVREHLRFHAALRLGGVVDRKERESRIEEVIAIVGLSQCTDMQLKGVGKGLSSGELRKLAFATKLLTKPSVFICDEPTTGLDSFMAEQLIMILKHLASSGMTIICVIHQPSSFVFALFDRVMFLAHGRVAYQGPVKQSIEFFRDLGFLCPDSYNPADFIINTLGIDETHQQEKEKSIDKVWFICDSYFRSRFAKETDELVPTAAPQNDLVESVYADLDNVQRYKVNMIQEVWWLIWRSLLLNFRDPNILRTRISQKLILGVVYGLIFHGTVDLTQQGIQNANGAMLCLVIESSFRIVLNVVQIFVFNLPLFRRENESCLYRASTYYVANTISWVPVFLVDTSLFTLIAYFLMGLSLDVYKFLMTLLMSLVIAHVSFAVGSFLAYFSPSMAVAISFAQQTQYLMMLFSGALYINLSTYPRYLAWLQYFSWMRYGFEAMAIIHWSDIQNITCSAVVTDPCITTGIEVLEANSYKPENLGFDFGMSFALFGGFHIIAFVCLILRTSNYRKL